MSKIYYIYDAFSISFRFITIFLSKCYHTIFLLIAGYVVIGEASPERESCPEDRLERYSSSSGTVPKGVWTRNQ